jgi:uncharacterized membrane protein YsdA (DUF1294 family)
MPSWLPVLIAVLLGLNVASFGLFAVDKRRARRGGRRIPEATLLLSGLVSGTVGAWLAMWAFRHKTRKRAFQAQLALATLVDAALVAWLLRR